MKIITLILGVIIMVVMLVLQMVNETRRALENATGTFRQMEQVLEENQNDLSYIFSLFRVNPEVNYYAIDKESGEIIGSTDLEFTGKQMAELGLDWKTVKNHNNGVFAKIDGENSYCVFTEEEDYYIGYTVSASVLFQRVPTTMLALAVSLVIIAIILIYAVTWCMKRYITDGIYDINEKLRMITRGNLEETVDVHNSVEFAQLSSYINKMVKRLLDDNLKMSYVLSKTNMYIGVYEYNQYMNKVRFTEYIPKILSLNAFEAEQLACNYKRFQKFMKEIRKEPVPGEKGVYRLEENRYVKIEEIQDEHDDNGVFGVVIDVTEEMIRRRKIESERDIDLLTGLYNRRGVDAKFSLLFEEPEKLGCGAMIMVDADGLKAINDNYGHEKGDIYLQEIGRILSKMGTRSNLAARQGGDEFVLFLYHYDNEEELLNDIGMLEYIQNHTRAKLDKDLSVPIRFSFGYSLLREGADYQMLLSEADGKMYENKKKRKTLRAV
jgi:diguanylate cyclase (GGDEF)-like protein